MCHRDQGYAEVLSTGQCNRFLQLSVAEMAEKGTYPVVELTNTTLLYHMVETQQPAADKTTCALVLDSMLLSLTQEQGDAPQQANNLLLRLYSSFLPLLHSQLSTSADTCAVYARAMAALRRIHELSAAFLVFLLMAQNKVDGLTQECCEEVLELSCKLLNVQCFVLNISSSLCFTGEANCYRPWTEGTAQERQS